MDHQQSALVSACLANQSIIDALNLTDQLDQVALMKVPSFNMSSEDIISIALIRILQQQIDGYADLPNTFVDDSFSYLNNLTNPNIYGRNNITS